MTYLSLIIIAISISWAFIYPDLWAWALGYGVITITMLSLAHNAGIRQGQKSAINNEPIPREVESPDETSEAEAQLESFETALAEAELFAYELKNDLVPDGNTEDNPGYGPMDFDEWREWKQQEFERTGNLWHNHPDGLPPKEDDTA